jgi:YidC/Oxa1 family membrane protein insertase
VNIFDLPVLSAILAAASAALAALGALVTPAGAIVLVTIGIRALLIPVGVSLARADIARRRLAPRIAELQKRFAKNPERLQRETLALYAAEKVSPFAGCLPVLAQAPVLTLVYALFASPQIAGAPNELLVGSLFGAPLGRHLADLAAGVSVSDLVFAGLMVALVGVAVLARRAARRAAAQTPSAAGVGAASSGIASVLSWAPFITVIAAAFLPLAAGLYLTLSSAWTLAERAVLRRILAPAA